jgi:hypothetical protein
MYLFGINLNTKVRFMKKIILGALASFLFIGNANAYKPCNSVQVDRAKSYCSTRSATYRGCKAYDNGNITAVCELKSGQVIEENVTKAVPLREKTK